MKKLLFVSMLGEPSHYNVKNYKSLCCSGLEKDWISEWYRPLVEEYGFSLSSVDICRGDALPEASSVDCVLLGGTIHDVREKFDWLSRLTSWLKEYRKLDRPLLGICGGHQLVSSAFDEGEVVDKSEGLSAGTYNVKLSEVGLRHPLFYGMGEEPRFHFSNSLHVVPSEPMFDRILVTKDKSLAVAIDHGNHWYSCQFHPESKFETWECVYKDIQEVIVMSAYSKEHDGEKLLRNFLKLAQATLG